MCEHLEYWIKILRKEVNRVVTKNQIDYQNFLESARHNATSEAEILRHNQRSESQTDTAQALEAERNKISAYQAQSGRIQAQASAAQAGAAQLNALTNQRAQQLKEDQWTNPFGGGGTVNAVGVVKTGVDALSGFARFLTILKS